MTYKCEIRQQPEQPVLLIHKEISVKDLPQTLGAIYSQIGQYLCELGQSPCGAPFVAYFNMDMENLEIEAGFPVSSPLPARNEIQSTQLSAGTVAACLYRGPYQGCGLAYQQLTAFIKEQGYTPTGISYEYYLNDPAVTPPDQVLTDIVFPLSKP